MLFVTKKIPSLLSNKVLSPVVSTSINSISSFVFVFTALLAKLSAELPSSSSFCRCHWGDESVRQDHSRDETAQDRAMHTPHNQLLTANRPAAAAVSHSCESEGTMSVQRAHRQWHQNERTISSPPFVVCLSAAIVAIVLQHTKKYVS